MPVHPAVRGTRELSDWRTLVPLSCQGVRCITNFGSGTLASRCRAALAVTIEIRHCLGYPGYTVNMLAMSRVFVIMTVVVRVGLRLAWLISRTVEIANETHAVDATDVVQIPQSHGIYLLRILV